MRKWEIRQGDWIETLRSMPDESVQCCVTSPPYWGLRDYGVVGQLGVESTPEDYVAKIVEGFREVRRVLRKDGTLWINLGDSYASDPGKGGSGTFNGRNGYGEGYARPMRAGSGRADGVVDERGQRNRDGVPPTHGLKAKDLVGIPWMSAFALRSDGWYLRSTIIWAKDNPMPESVRDRPTKSYEHIFLMSKSERYYYDAEAIAEPCISANEVVWAGQGNGLHSGESHVGNRTKRFRQVGTNAFRGAGSNRESENGPTNRDGRDMNETAGGLMRNKRDVWNISTKPYPEAHFATFPPEIPENCIKAGTKEGDTVLDPFNGAGTTGLVATRLNRNYIGIELNPEYIEMSKRRITEDAPMFNQMVGD